MNPRDDFEHLMASLHAAALDDARWPAASELIDEAIGCRGDSLLVASGRKDDASFDFDVRLYRGERRQDLERDYWENCGQRDDRLTRLRRLPEDKLTNLGEMYAQQELKTSPAHNEFCPLPDGSTA